jgi:hypothetical protein
MIARSTIRIREAQSLAPQCRRGTKPLWQKLTENAHKRRIAFPESFRDEIAFRVRITNTWHPSRKLGSAPKLARAT